MIADSYLERALGVRGSVRLDVRELDHLGPLLGFVGDELAEVAGRSRKRRAAQVGKPRATAACSPRPPTSFASKSPSVHARQASPNINRQRATGTIPIAPEHSAAASFNPVFSKILGLPANHGVPPRYAAICGLTRARARGSGYPAELHACPWPRRGKCGDRRARSKCGLRYA
jgi:hypothetical protein